MGDNENVTVKQIWLGILLVILFIVGYTGADYLLLRRKDIPVNPPTNTISSVDIEVATSTINPEQGQIISAPLTDWKIFDSYKKTTIYPKGVETPSDYLQNAGQALSNAGRRVEIIGSLEDAYIYIKAGANDQRANFTAIDPRYDGIWFYRKDGQFNGGLLDLSQSRRGEPTQYTELLYNLKDVPLALNNVAYRKNDFTPTDILSQLKTNDYLAALVSTARYGRIMNLDIGYKCAVTTPDCAVRVTTK